MLEQNTIEKPTIIGSDKQRRVVEILSENIRNNQNKTKGEILLEAGYSETISKKPHLVFGSPKIQAMIEHGLNPTVILESLQRKATVKHIQKMNFPKYNEFADNENQFTDEDIKQMFLDMGIKVRKITYEGDYRVAYFLADKEHIQLEASEKIINLLGMYAPKVTKGELEVNHKFSMSELRKKAVAKGITTIDPVTVVTTPNVTTHETKE